MKKYKVKEGKIKDACNLYFSLDKKHSSSKEDLCDQWGAKYVKCNNGINCFVFDTKTPRKGLSYSKTTYDGLFEYVPDETTKGKDLLEIFEIPMKTKKAKDDLISLLGQSSKGLKVKKDNNEFLIESKTVINNKDLVES